MDAALGWISDVVRFLLGLLPHRIIMPTTHSGVKFVAGTTVVVMTHDNGMWLPTSRLWKWYRSGIHWYWPFLTEIKTYPIRRQTVGLDPQTIMSSDGYIMGVSGILVYRVADIKALLTEVYDPEETIRDHAIGAITEVVSAKNSEYLQHKATHLNTRLTKALAEILGPFGVCVIQVRLRCFFPINHTVALWQTETSEPACEMEE